MTKEAALTHPIERSDVDETGRRRAIRAESGFGAIVAALPDRITMLFLAACFAISIALIVQHFVWWLVVPLFLVAAALLWRFLPGPVQTGGRQALGAVASVIIAIAWLGANLPFVSQLVQVSRDPGVYTALGMWLMDHQTIGIDVSTTTKAVRGLSDFNAHLGEFGPDPRFDPHLIVHIQGGALLPGFLGVGGWIGGQQGVLAANLVIGAVGLVAMYALARRFVRPWLAIVVELALGFSIAFIYLMRAPYSESIMFIVCAAGPVWLLAGWKQRRPALFAVAGLFLGASSFARIDGLLALIGVTVALGASALIVADRDQFRSLAAGAQLFFLTGLATSALGVYGLYVNERFYLMALSSNFLLLAAATIGVIVIAEILIVVRLILLRRRVDAAGAARAGWAGLSDRALRGWGVVLGVLVPLGFAVWLSRPLWWHGHYLTGGYITAIGDMQKAEGLPVDGTRSYDEYTLFWVAWYFGWPMVIFAGLGLGALLRQSLRHREIGMLILGFSALVTAVLYLDRVSISPDQVWAYRRLLPIITSGFLVGAAFFIERLLRGRGLRWLRSTIAVIAAALVAFSPLVPYNDLLEVPDGQGELGFIRQICSQLTSDNVLMITTGAPANFALTLHVMCGVNVVSGTGRDPDQLAELQKRMPDLQVLVFLRAAMAGTSQLGAPDASVDYLRWDTSLTGIPTRLVSHSQQVWIGTADSDGVFVHGG